MLAAILIYKCRHNTADNIAFISCVTQWHPLMSEWVVAIRVLVCSAVAMDLSTQRPQ